MAGTWVTIDATDWRLAGVEPKGMNEHHWLADSATSRPWLFKVSRDSRARALQEHTVEKLASEFASLLGVPAARVELGQRAGETGALVQSAKPAGWDLHAGQELMVEAQSSYDPQPRFTVGHSPATIRTALAGFGPPLDSGQPSGFCAFDTFTGYLIFDALIAHGDRHDRNWAVLRPPPGVTETDVLCASFDHAASLGHTLTEDRCARHLREQTVRRWAERGQASRFELAPRGKAHTLVELAGVAASLCQKPAVTHWQERVLSVQRDSVDAITESAEDAAPATRDFVVELVMINRERLLGELASIS